MGSEMSESTQTQNGGSSTMTTSNNPTADTQDNDSHIKAAYTACNVDLEKPDMITIPEVGAVERDGYVPISRKSWPTVLREQHSSNAMTGNTEVQKSILLGLDERGRAVYATKSYGSSKLQYIVPKHHPHFETSEDDRLINKFPPKHAPGGYAPVNAPNGDVLVSVRKESCDFQVVYPHSPSVLESVMERAQAENWTYLSEWVKSRYDHFVNTFTRENYPNADQWESLIEDLHNPYHQ